MFKFCTSSNLLFYYELLIGTQPSVLECVVIFLQSDWSTLSNVFERRTSTGSVLFALLRSDFKPMFGQIVFIRIKTLGNTNTVVPRHIKREKKLTSGCRASLKSVATQRRFDRNPTMQHNAKISNWRQVTGITVAL